MIFNHEHAWNTPAGLLLSCTPHFENLCDHPRDSYVGSFSALDGPYTRGDVYVYDAFHNQHVCVRVGDDQSDYLSVGTPLDLLISAERQDAPAVYRAAAAAIDRFRAVRFNPPGVA